MRFKFQFVQSRVTNKLFAVSVLCLWCSPSLSLKLEQISLTQGFYLLARSPLVFKVLHLLNCFLHDQLKSKFICIWSPFEQTSFWLDHKTSKAPLVRSKFGETLCIIMKSSNFRMFLRSLFYYFFFNNLKILFFSFFSPKPPST